MRDLLDFLNTTDIDSLTQTTGISRTLAETLIAARPFDSVDDVMKVKGMGKATLARLQSAVGAGGTDSENSAMLPVEQEAMPAPIEETPAPARENVQKQDSFLKRLGRAFVAFLYALLRLIMLVILFVSVGAAFYYGLPYLQRTFLAPVKENTAQIENMEAEITELQSQLEELNSRVATLEGSVEAQTASIQKLEGMQATIEAQLQENNDAVLLELKHEVMFARALDVLARARLYLAQSNFGMAEIDVQTARDLLAELNAEKNDAALITALERLDLSLGNLPDFPVVAAGDLEIAWQILLSGEAPVVPTSTPEPFTATPTPVPSDTFTPTALPPVEATPTP